MHLMQQEGSMKSVVPRLVSWNPVVVRCSRISHCNVPFEGVFFRQQTEGIKRVGLRGFGLVVGGQWPSFS